MLNEIRASYVSKFDQPISAYMYASGADEETGSSTEWTEWCGRYGRRLVHELENGAVWSERYPTEDAARDAFAYLDELYSEFLGDEDC